MNGDHLEFCGSQTCFCPMRWLANPPSRADNPLWKPKTANQQWYQRLSILANVLKYPAKTHLGFLTHHSTISRVIHHQRHSKNGSIFEPGLVIRRFLWTQWHASNRFLWIQWSWGGIYIHPELMGEVELVKFTTYMVILDGGSVWKFWPYWSIFSWIQPYTYIHVHTYSWSFTYIQMKYRYVPGYMYENKF